MAQYTLARLTSEYRRLWAGMQVLPKSRRAAEAAANKIIRGKKTYLQAEKRTGVKWFVIGLIHYRESNCDFDTWLHNGDPMRRKDKPVRTVHIPIGRPPNPGVDWVEGAFDALVTVEHLDAIHSWGVEHVAFSAEKMNGFGYRNPTIDIPSPYLWGGSNRQKRGKFYADRKYSATIWDTQLGAMTVLRALMDLDSDASFDDVAKPPKSDDVDDTAPDDTAEPEADEEPSSYSPKAGDPDAADVKPLVKSKTIWGGILSWFAGMGSTIAGMFEYLATPWGFAIFATLLTVISVGAFLVIKGRIDVQKLVDHLSPDDEEDATDE